MAVVLAVGASLVRHLGVGVEFLGVLRVAETGTGLVKPASVSTWSGNVRTITAGYIYRDRDRKRKKENENKNKPKTVLNILDTRTKLLVLGVCCFILFIF